jgi:hypothetical protein
MPQFQFDASEVAPQQSKSYEPLPRGMYQAIVIESSIKPTKAGTGEYIELVIQVTDGVHSGRRLWERLNVSNPNKTAEDIARAQLASLCQAVGVTKLSNTEQLHDIPFAMEVDIDRKDPTRNRIYGYGSLQLAAQTKPAAAPAAAGAAKPWAKR